jgi:Tfp pilus assembly protein PilE
MRSKLKVISVILVVCILATIGYGFFQFNRVNKDLQGAKADMALPATTLVKEYSANEAIANKKFLNKIINVKGKIHSIERDSLANVTIFFESDDPMSSVSCQLDKTHVDQVSKLHVGDSISVVGMCTGFLTDVVLTRCSVE